MRDYFEQRIKDELDADGQVEIAGRVWPNSDAFKHLDEPDFNSYIDEVVEEKKVEAKQLKKN